ncbi:four helix bundle protein [Cruoricaptor ignavus]|uniref:Four helix bundle protein n=1 Tax=Cruoricaptor ignavus TaxID=1118202 RepID=A0A1M6FKW6_9FLAO|nr:four helix bundle protein [Cruoricaptor ignavus]SHI98314.1 four helix bundle protein [Cruoricaptor ignavus]
MPKIERFEDMEIWQRARALCQKIYAIIQDTPLKSNFKLANQIDGSSGSIMDNIAEGFERNGNKEFLQFLSIAKGSCGETRSQLYRLFDRNFINEKDFNSLLKECEDLSRKISAFMNYLNGSTLKGAKFKQP